MAEGHVSERSNREVLEIGEHAGDSNKPVAGEPRALRRSSTGVQTATASPRTLRLTYGKTLWGFSTGRFYGKELW